ncbi:trk system potassium uptake protein TrkH [Loktanella atrilutea]|uniref:Trk system potassium uptake protein TrkH n=1 Tax=Loktanella atrilutea TaxID=366533 RepID=A0A1M4UDK6_LOKAT|nr:potassium transporter TrkG [Loktanella atrilutea]SHE54941.1 trk system potassium uptake protein TrkH [Loktanella atrilutea]
MDLKRARGRLHLQSLRIPPPAVLALLYLGSVIVGGLLLWLPVSTQEQISLFTALFISTSAVTVTGLSTVDIGTTFSLFGEAVIMVLIQLGGLGLMTFAVLVLSAMGIPIGMPQRLILREDLNQTTLNNLTVLVRIIFSVALLCEAVGVLALAWVWVPQFGWAQGLWYSAFHAVSAFNNAGFALFPGSLSLYVGDPVVNIVIPALFILGGLGFIVVGDIYQKRKWSRLTLHSKLMLVGTAALIVWGFVTFAALEWNNPGTLGDLPDTATKLWASWFQAVTPRTAGFNTINTAEMHDSTTLMTMLLMLVGGGSTSTAGGIKVTTLIVLILATAAFFRRSTTLHVFGRSLKMEEIMKVMALTTVSMLLVALGLFAVSISHDGNFLDLMFEVTSAFGTVGLSRGATAQLDTFGLTLIMIIMFIGRVGPLTIGFFLATRSVPRVRYPAGQIYLG